MFKKLIAILTFAASFSINLKIVGAINNVNAIPNYNITLTPNPVYAQANLLIETLAAVKATVYIINSDGKKVMVRQKKEENHLL